MYGQVPEPERPWLVGLPLFLDTAGIGKAGTPFAMRPFFALRCLMASSMDKCSMWRIRLLTVLMASFTSSGSLLRAWRVWVGVVEKKMGMMPAAKEPSSKSALSGKDPKRTETALPEQKNFF